MKSRHLMALPVAVMLAGSVILAAKAQDPVPPGPPVQGGGLQILEFRPAFDDQMTMLIQPRHTKLYYAAEAENWRLTGFELGELRNAFSRIARSIPNYGGSDLANAFASMMNPALDDALRAVATQDSAAFSEAYIGITEACNLCHQTLDHAFIVVKVPDVPAAVAFPDQDFAPLPQ